MENFYEILTILNKFIFILFLYTVDSLLFKSEIFLWKKETITETYAFLIYLYTEIPIHFLSESSIDIFFNTSYLTLSLLEILQNKLCIWNFPEIEESPLKKFDYWTIPIFSLLIPFIILLSKTQIQLREAITISSWAR